MFKVHIDIYLYNKEKSEYKYQVSSYFNLVKENPKITYKKDIYKRNKRCQGYNFHEQIKIIEQNVCVDVAKYQPFYNSNNPEYERGQFGERYISQKI